MDCKDFDCVIADTCMYREAEYCNQKFKVCFLSCPCEVCSKRKKCSKNLFDELYDLGK